MHNEIEKIMKKNGFYDLIKENENNIKSVDFDLIDVVGYSLFAYLYDGFMEVERKFGGVHAQLAEDDRVTLDYKDKYIKHIERFMSIVKSKSGENILTFDFSKDMIELMIKNNIINPNDDYTENIIFAKTFKAGRLSKALIDHYGLSKHLNELAISALSYENDFDWFELYNKKKKKKI